MNSSSVQKQLKAAGIDTNSKKYKAAPVSYTHLAQSGMAAKFSSRYFAFSGSFIHFCKNALETDTAVSYTHLDVYKRQVYWIPSSSASI